MKIAVCDDEKVIREQLVRLLQKQSPDCQIETYATGEELLAAKQHFDIVFC